MAVFDVQHGRMHLRAQLSLDDLTRFVAEFSPVRFDFAAENARERYLLLEPPTSVTLVADAGVRIVTSAWIRWSLSVFTVPIALPHVTVLLRPSIAKSPTLKRGCLVFHLEIETMDVAKLPAFVDHALMQRLNEELAHHPLVWDFGKTLGHTFELPRNIPPVEAISLQVHWGELRVGEDGLFLDVSIDAGVVRDPKRPANPH